MTPPPDLARGVHPQARVQARVCQYTGGHRQAPPEGCIPRREGRGPGPHALQQLGAALEGAGALGGQALVGGQALRGAGLGGAFQEAAGYCRGPLLAGAGRPGGRR